MAGSPRRLEDRVAVMTGSTRGIGWAIAEDVKLTGPVLLPTGCARDAPRPRQNI